VDALDYQKRALKTLSGSITSSQGELTNAVLGLTGEAGECADLLKKHLYHGHALDTWKMARELGDVLWYIALAAYSMGYGLDEIMTLNLDKLAARYPQGFTTEASLNREEEEDA